MDWFEQVRAAEAARDWDTAITLVSAYAECFADDFYLHDNHLWHMDLLARAERIPELTQRALTDVHARRRLNKLLGERGMEAALRHRAEDGDRHALYVYVRLLCETSRAQEARQAVQAIDPENQYARQIITSARRP